MFAKSRTSALFVVIAFVICWIGAYFPIFTHFGGQALALPQGAGSLLTMLMAFIIIFIMAIFVSRMSLVTSLGERGFGLGGLARWSVLGVLIGASFSLAYVGMQNALGDTPTRAGLEPLVIIALFFLLYWLVFQRSPLRIRPDESHYLPDRRMVWVLILLDLLVMLVGFIILARITPTPLWPAAYVNFGLGALNCNAADLVQGKPARQRNLILAGLFLIGLGLLVALFG